MVCSEYLLGIVKFMLLGSILREMLHKAFCFFERVGIHRYICFTKKAGVSHMEKNIKENVL